MAQRSEPAAKAPPRFFELIPPGTTIDFIGLQRYSFALSIVLILASVLLWIVRGGPNYGVDFAGGVMVHLRFQGDHDVSEVRRVLGDAGYGDVQLQELSGAENEFLLHLASDPENENVAKQVTDALQAKLGSDAFEVLRSEMVGPKVGGDLRRKAMFSVVASTIMMGLYLAFRFQPRFGIGAAVALAHDVIITVGGLLLFNYEFDLPVVAALLTVTGFSVNDTVIVFDRIRENQRKMRRHSPQAIANSSINETLSRTVITNSTAIFAVVALFLFGGGVIHGFAFALLVGFVVGTYSSVFVATPVVLMFREPAR